MSGYKAECRKFQANIFNKSKCTNCFKQREEHSTDALDSNRPHKCSHSPSSPSSPLSPVTARLARPDEYPDAALFGPPYLFDGPLMWQPRLKESPRLLLPCSGADASLTLTPSPALSPSWTAASRKVSKCGYLFVAPDWDFTIPLYRTKRWQRRWFVLYDDGELTYSVDDLPATIPQGVVDMNRVLEVSNAEDITGNKYSLALTAPDRVTFVKGTSPEESRWWQDVLSIFPRMHKHGRHKRNATFPGIKGSSGGVSSTSAGHQHARVGANTRGPSTLESPVNQRVRFNSISSDLRGARRPSSAPSLDSTERLLFSSGRFGSPAVTASSGRGGSSSSSSRHYDSVNESSNGSDVSNEEEDEDQGRGDTIVKSTALDADQANQNVGDVIENNSTRSNNDKNSFYNNNNSGNNNRNTASFTEPYSSGYGGAYYSSSSNNMSSSSGVTPYNSLHYSRSMPIPTPTTPSATPASHSTPLPSNPSRIMRDEHKENTPPYMPEYHDNPPTSESPPTQDKHTHRLRTRRALNREARALSQPRSEQLQPCSVLADLEASKREEKLKDIAASITTTSSRRRHHQLLHHANSQGSAVDKPTRDRDPEDAGDNAPTDTPPPAQLRGAPDGCGGTDDSGSGSLQRVDLPAEDLLYIKKGWLLKAGDKQEWNKYWFVLHGGGLRFYRNSGAEDTGIMDGIIDLGTAKDVHNKDVARNYGFVIKTWSGQQYVFSAVTAGIRNNWVQALRNAANLKTAPTVSAPADPDKETLNKSAIIESLAAEKDQTTTTKSLQAYNNKNTSLSNSMNNIINNKSYTSDGIDKSISFTNSSGVSKSNTSLNAIEDGNGKGHTNGLSGDNSQLQGTSSPYVSRTPHQQSGTRVAALSSDEEYKTASETSANSNLSNDNADFFDWKGPRSRNSSGRTTCTERRSQSSPPNSRRGTLDSFPNMDTSYGLNSSILDRYKNMQNHTRSQVVQSPVSRSSTTTTSAAPDEVDHPRSSSSVAQHEHCDALSTCARLGNLSRDDTGFRLSDSMRSLDLDASLQHDKSGGTTSSQETLSSPNELEETKLLLVDTRGYLADTRDRLAETRDQLETVQKQNLQYQAELKDSKNELLRCQTELEESKVEASRYLSQLEQSQNEVLQYKTQLEESRNVVLKFQAQLEGSAQEVCQYQNQLEESQDLVHQLQQQLEESQDFVHQLQQQLEQTRNELEKTQHHLQEACENHVAFKAEMEEQESQRQRLHSQNFDAEAEEGTSEEHLEDFSRDGTSRMEEQENIQKLQQMNEMNELVSTLRDEVDRLTDQLSLKERQLLEENSTLQALRLKHEREKSAWRGRAESTELQLQQLADSRQDTILQLRSSLEASEHRVAVLAAQLEGRNSRTAKEGHAATNNTLDALQRENATLARQLSESQAEAAQLKDNLKCEKSEVYKWKDLVKELRSLLDGRNVDMDRKREEIRVTRESLRSQQQEHAVTRDRLQRGIEENETLSTRIRELQRQLHSQEKRASSTPSVYSSREKFSSRRQLPRLDSLSDLSNVDFSIDPEMLDKEGLTDEYCEVRARLERAIGEIRALRRELRESQDAHDSLQLTHLQQGQDLTRQKQDAVAQLQLMTERVQDLTNKLSNSEKQVRLLKTKVTRAAAESRDRRRTHSLKGKEAFGLGKDVDQKLSQLEAKIAQLMPTIDTGLTDCASSSVFQCAEDSSKTPSEELRASATSTPTSSGSRPHLKHTKRSKSFDDPSKATRLRRKSLESSSGGDGGVKAALRINNIEAKVAALTPARSRSPSRTGSPAESPLRSPSMSRRTKSRGSLAERGSRSRRADSDGRSSVADLPATDTLGLVCSQLCECVEWLDTYRCSCGNTDLSTLQQRLASTHQLAAGGAQLGPAATSPVAERVQPVAQQMVLLLQQKIAALAERRDTLKATSSWTKEAQMKNFAERIAYETVLLSQVSQALRLSNQSNCNLDSIKLQDLMESHRKMAFLEKKLTNPEFDLDTMAPLEFYTSMLAEKLVVTGEILSSVNSINERKQDSTLDATCRDLQGRLLERERLLARLVMSYKEEKLHEVAVVMAQELNSSTPVDDTILMEEVRIREAWTTAHQLLVQEIVNHQTSQSLLRLTHLLNPPNDSNPVASLSLTLCSAEAVDRLQTAAEESLRQEMEESVLTLSQKYEEVLAQYRAGDTSLVNSVSASMDEVLTEFAGVMAQKALIDGHLALLQDEFDKGSLQTTQDSLIISEDNKDPMESAGDVLDSEAHLLMFLGGRDSSVESLVKPALSHSEFTFVFNKASNQCSTESTNLLMQLLSQKAEASELAPLGSSSSYRSSTRSLQHASPAVSDRDQDSLEQPQLRSAISLSKILPSPKARRKSETRKSRRSSDITGMTSLGCRQCEELRQELNKLKKKLQIQNTVDEGKECDTCPKLLDTIERLEMAQRANASRVGSGDGDSDDELSRMKERIMVVEASYEAQIAVLQQKYEEALAANPDSCDETAREKYQKEIEQLRGLCEMGLGTMESSQQRIVAEIKEKHRRELTLLQAEKEQALAEETQATLAALDAMRKAHEAEVQREVAKIKEEFIRKMQAGEDIGKITQQHETEMRDIRREILSLSEKYSVKCLEAADQETRIENLNKQLVETTKTVTELEARNTKLKAQLTEKIEAIKSGASAGDTESELRVRVAEAVVKEDRLAKMNTQLQKAQAMARKDPSSSRDRRARTFADPKSSPAKN